MNAVEPRPECPKSGGGPSIRPSCRACPVAGFAFYGEAMRRHRFDPDEVRRDVVTLGARSEIRIARSDRPRLQVLREGWAFDYRLAAGGKRQILGFLLPGDLVAPDLLGGRPIRHRVRALTPVVLCGLDVEAIDRSPDCNRTLRRGLTGQLAEACGTMREHVASVGAGFAGAGVARLLLDLFDRLGRRGMVAGQSFDFPVAQVHMADALGISKVHVSRVLSGFRRDGLVEYGPGWMRIRDMRGLRLAGSLPPE